MRYSASGITGMSNRWGGRVGRTTRARSRVDRLVGKTYLTDMNAQIKVSAKGQVVIPKDVRDRLGIAEGSMLDVIESGDGVFLRKPAKRKKMTVEEATAFLREKINYKGPPLPIERLSWSAEVDREFERSRK